MHMSPSFSWQLALHHDAMQPSATMERRGVKVNIYFFLISCLLPFIPHHQDLEAALLSQFDYKISIAIHANLPWESSKPLLVYNRYDEGEKPNTNGEFVAGV